MSKHIQLDKSELFVDLSEQEQELISAGSLAFFLQLTKANSFANNLINVSDGGKSISINQASGSNFSQFTLAIDSVFFTLGSRESRERRLNSLLFLLWRILN